MNEPAEKPTAEKQPDPPPLGVTVTEEIATSDKLAGS